MKGMSERTLRRGLEMLDMKSRVRPRRQLLTGVQKERRLERGSRVLNWCKRGGNGKKVKVFTDEKNFYSNLPNNCTCTIIYFQLKNRPVCPY